jgi:hypothetical protein
MATQLPVAGISLAGSPGVDTAADLDGNLIPNPGDVILALTNSGGSSATVQVAITTVVDGQPVNPRQITIPAGQTRWCGPYDVQRYSSQLAVTASSVDILIRAIRLGTAITIPASGGRFVLDGLAVIADLDQGGLTADGNALVVDLDVTGATADGNAVVVTL